MKAMVVPGPCKGMRYKISKPEKSAHEILLMQWFHALLLYCQLPNPPIS